MNPNPKTRLLKFREFSRPEESTKFSTPKTRLTALYENPLQHFLADHESEYLKIYKSKKSSPRVILKRITSSFYTPGLKHVKKTKLHFGPAEIFRSVGASSRRVNNHQQVPKHHPVESSSNMDLKRTSCCCLPVTLQTWSWIKK